MSVLFRTYQVANFKVAHRNLKSRPEFGKFFHCKQTLFRFLAKLFIAPEREIRISKPIAAPHSSSELIHLRKPEPVCVFYYNGVHVCNIQTRFDNGCANKNIYLSVRYIHHNGFKLVLAHLSVSDRNVRLRQHLSYTVCRFVYSVNTVIEIIDLSASRKLALHRLSYHIRFVFHNISFNGVTFARRLIYYAHIPNAAERHMQGSRNRCCRKSEDINITFQGFDFFLVCNAETLFLIDYKQPEFFKL